ncbi:MAG: efflux RND transporter periplasmic adaptor subunit [Clostridiales bacterium]|jgi:multidrug efflux pump subunit AcrA (membrane-fusion protein)|nr:efflux RND transporter periplasmic adaptor subunit [Clostridiales bacterium]
MKRLVQACKKFFSVKRNRIIAIVAVSALIIATAAYTALKPRSVPVIAAVTQPFSDYFYETGVVRAVERGIVSAYAGGRVVEVLAREGQQVARGDILVRLDSAALTAERALLVTERNAVLAGWEQSREQIAQQITGLRAQRAGFDTADVSDMFGLQIELLDASMDKNVPHSVAWGFERMLDATERRMRYGGQTGYDAAQYQLETAQAQQLAITNQMEQYNLQLQQQLFELNGKLAQAATQTEIDYYEDLIDKLNNNNNAVLDSYDAMKQSADAQVTRLTNGLGAGGVSQDSQLALQSELAALQEQYTQFLYNTKMQIVSLSAQQEQAAAAAKSARGARNSLGDQIGLLEQSLEEGSGTAGYYATLLEKADASIVEADRRIAQCELAAPLAGIVGAIPFHEGQYLQPGQSVTEVVALDTLQIECMVLTEDAAGIAPGMDAAIIWERRDGDMEYPCTVKEISALAVESVSAVGLAEQRVRVVLQADFGEKPGPGDGFTVRVRFTIASQTGIVVPQIAVLQTELGDAVLVIRDGRATLAPVTLGLSNGDMVTVLSGLNEADTVIAEPTGIRKGQAVIRR